MKIAYLILCHKNDQQVELLINHLSNEESDFYVHIDQKNSCFKIKETENVIVLDYAERVKVHWGTITMVKATIELINKCLTSGKKYDYVFLISGQDFPIKSNNELFSYLEENLGSNYIEILPHNKKNRTIFQKRYELYYPYWMQYSNSIIVKLFRKIYIFLSGGKTRTYHIFKRNCVCGLRFEYGSQWWCLQRECLLWMMDYIKNNPKYLAFFEHTLIPDECFFQTLFANSPFANTRKDILLYVDWSDHLSHPGYIKECNIPQLIDRDGVFFARKFDMELNPVSLERIIEHLEKNV